MSNYKFNLVDSNNSVNTDARKELEKRPLSDKGRSFENDAVLFVPGEELETAINTAIAVGEPLLITGEPGTGKTQTAYYIANMLNIKPVIDFHVKSDSTARDLLYYFDAVRYFHDAHLKKDNDLPDKAKYIEKRAMWEAFESNYNRVILIDEIDKAPRDFPNDLLYELDQMEFKIIETQKIVKGKKNNPPIVVITSNSERRLPEPFLRRCVYHHIEFSEKIVREAVFKRTNEFPTLSKDFLETAIDRFISLREIVVRKPPTTSELLVWLRVLGLNENKYSKYLDDKLSKLPYLGTLIKDHQELRDLKQNA